MLKSQKRTVDKRLSELVAEVACSVGSLDEDFDGCLIKPFALVDAAFPFPAVEMVGKRLFVAGIFFESRIRSHVNRRSCNRETAFSACHTVADFAARTGCSTVERLYRSRKIMGFGFHRKHGFHVFYLKLRRFSGICGRKLLACMSFQKRNVVFISRNYSARICA